MVRKPVPWTVVERETGSDVNTRNGGEGEGGREETVTLQPYLMGRKSAGKHRNYKHACTNKISSNFYITIQLAKQATGMFLCFNTRNCIKHMRSLVALGTYMYMVLTFTPHYIITRS